MKTEQNRAHEIQHHISILDVSPERLTEIAREHWKIASMHWMLYVTFSEDQCRFFSKNAHKALNAMRKYALVAHKGFLLKTHKNPLLNFLCLPLSSTILAFVIYWNFYETSVT